MTPSSSKRQKSKENDFILLINIAPRRQKLGITLGNKGFLKLKLSKKFNNKKCSPN